jgi:hypothetical protein
MKEFKRKKWVARIPPMDEYGLMSQTENGPSPVASVDEIQKSWHDLTLRVDQLETGNAVLEHENKALRQLLERAIEYRKKSHGDLVNLLTTLVSKLPINDIGVVVSRLVEHNVQVGDISAALLNGKNDDAALQPAILKALDKTKRDLQAAIQPLVEELIKQDAPLDAAMLQSLVTQPESFFTPTVVRASRCFVKGQVPREKIVQEYGEEALIFFKDLTTDPKFNPRPKLAEVLLGFAPDFEALFQQNPNVCAAKRNELAALHQRIRNSRSARAQKIAFLKLSFVLELLHYYDNQNTESPDVIFAQRLPPLIEQLVVCSDSDIPDEKLVGQAEALLAFIVNTDYRNAVVNNFGKSSGLAKTQRLVLTYRAASFNEHDPLTAEFVRHLLALEKIPRAETFVAVLRLLAADRQKVIIRAMINSGKLRKEEAEPLAKAIAKQLGLPEAEITPKTDTTATPNDENSWEHIKGMIANRATPNDVTVAIRKRLHAKFDDDEVKQSWLTLAESDPMVFVRVFCLLPYLPDGQTDPVARAVLESYANRLTHEKYAATYARVVHALKNLFKVKADSPALVNFIALVKWVDPESADKIAKDIGVTA